MNGPGSRNSMDLYNYVPLRGFIQNDHETIEIIRQASELIPKACDILGVEVSFGTELGDNEDDFASFIDNQEEEEENGEENNEGDTQEVEEEENGDEEIGQDYESNGDMTDEESDGESDDENDRGSISSDSDPDDLIGRSSDEEDEGDADVRVDSEEYVASNSSADTIAPTLIANEVQIVAEEVDVVDEAQERVEIEIAINKNKPKSKRTGPEVTNSLDAVDENQPSTSFQQQNQDFVVEKRLRTASESSSSSTVLTQNLLALNDNTHTQQLGSRRRRRHDEDEDPVYENPIHKRLRDDVGLFTIQIKKLTQLEKKKNRLLKQMMDIWASTGQNVQIVEGEAGIGIAAVGDANQQHVVENADENIEMQE